MVQATEKAVLDNLEKEITTWQERQIEVFNELPFSGFGIEKDTGYFQAVGWLNFAIASQKGMQLCLDGANK